MQDKYGDDTIGQIPHMDIGEQVEEVADDDDSTTKAFSVSDNPSLRNKFKPGSIIIPVGEERSIFICNGVGARHNKTEVHVKHGEMIVFEGDLVHGGTSYIAPADSKLELFPSIHTLIASTCHKRDLDLFDISTHHCLIDEDFQYYVPFLKEDLVVTEINRSFKSIKVLVETANKLGSDDTRKGVNTKLEDCIGDLHQFLPTVNKKSCIDKLHQQLPTEPAKRSRRGVSVNK